MNLNRIVSLISLCVLLSSSAIANGQSIGNNGVHVKMVPVQKGGHSDHSTASAICDLRLNQRDIILQFETTPFTHFENHDIHTDASLKASITKKVGNLSVASQKFADRTNVSGGDSEANIAMGFSGNGRAQIQLDVGIDDPNAPAGRHCATVIMTVTAN